MQKSFHEPNTSADNSDLFDAHKPVWLTGPDELPVKIKPSNDLSIHTYYYCSTTIHETKAPLPEMHNDARKISPKPGRLIRESCKCTRLLFEVDNRTTDLTECPPPFQYAAETARDVHQPVPALVLGTT